MNAKIISNKITPILVNIRAQVINIVTMGKLICILMGIIAMQPMIVAASYVRATMSCLLSTSFYHRTKHHPNIQWWSFQWTVCLFKQFQFFRPSDRLTRGKCFELKAHTIWFILSLVSYINLKRSFASYTSSVSLRERIRIELVLWWTIRF